MNGNAVRRAFQALMPLQKDNRKERLLYLDLLKAIAAFGVVFYHFAHYLLDYGFTPGTLYLPNFNRIILSFSSCSVPIFFLVNGILTFQKERSWKSMYLKAASILILTVFWSFTGFPSWFFRTLIILYLLHPALQFFFQHKRPLYMLLCVLVFIMPFVYNALVLCLKAAGVEALGPVGVDSLRVTGCFTMYSLLYFMIGPLLEKRKHPLWLGLICIACGWTWTVVECTVYTNLNQMLYDGVNNAFPTIGALLLAIGVYMLVRQCDLSKLKKILYFLSDGVLPVYLFHQSVIQITYRLIGFSRLSLISALLAVLCICAVCVMLGKLLLKVPVLCRLMRI